MRFNMLHKSRSSKVLFGVCGGLAKSLEIDPALLRIIFLLGGIFTGSLLVWVYLGLALVLPVQD